ncbi:Craniofacial development protein 1 [Linnemannia hyalina]|uniref:SWR1-complex protein 5 n=1 Tax=Linnemannia hyalina TaxID=64524 RepID=A0A9P7XNE9_9FUNG|nr:Craniofacial development protein 1 [Linnemannia hyalina]
MAKPKVPEKPPKPDEMESDSDDESDDEDYAPDEKDFQSDGEDLGDGSDDDENHTNDADTPTSTSRSGKRRAGADASSSSHKKPKPQQDPTPQEQAEATNKKSHLDALWAEMNAPASKPPLSTRRLELSGLGTSSSDKAAGAGGTGGSGRLVTITTTYDFAGETVTVTKDVPEDSKEAKEYAAKNGKAPVGANSSGSGSGSGTTTSAPTTTATTTDSIISTAQNLDTTSITSSSSSSATSSIEPSEASDASSIPRSNPAPGGPKITTRPSILDSLATKTKAPVRYIRKKSNLDELAATYGVKKPPKLNTLEKSKLDWKNFVGKEGIEDELKHHNKDGYMEKVAFLQRTDERRDQEYQELKKNRR